MIRPLSRVYLYREPSAATLDFDAVADFVDEVVGVPAEIRDEFVNHHLMDLDEAARRIAHTKVRNPAAPHAPEAPSLGEVGFEKRLIGDPAKRVIGILYDGHHLDAVFRRMIPPAERRADLCHVASTFRLLGTFFPSDGRYHARTVICGYPHIVSTSGIVEAPAKPREYYLLRRQYQAMGMTPPLEDVKRQVAGGFIDHDDPRMTEVVKGLVLQSIFHQAAGEAFCPSADCRLFDAHRQEELVHAQLESATLCETHEALAKRLARPE